VMNYTEARGFGHSRAQHVVPLQRATHRACINL
jgi:hypothetical protein